MFHGENTTEGYNFMLRPKKLVYFNVIDFRKGFMFSLPINGPVLGTFGTLPRSRTKGLLVKLES